MNESFFLMIACIVPAIFSLVTLNRWPCLVFSLLALTFSLITLFDRE